MRIVGGRFRGHRLSAPNSSRIRPTADRTRESLFNILANRLDLAGARVIDLFAGTGALGLEALSRGAGFALFVEEAAAARALIRANIEALGVTGETRLFRRDATRLGPAGRITPFDLAFLDPPYGRGLGEKALSALAGGGWLQPGALAILEEQASHLPDTIAGYERIDDRVFGDTAIAVLRRAAETVEKTRE